MENLSERIYWEIYRNFHNTICSETDGKIESKFQDYLEKSLYEDIALRCRFQLSIALSLLLEKKIKNGE